MSDLNYPTQFDAPHTLEGGAYRDARTAPALELGYVRVQYKLVGDAPQAWRAVDLPEHRSCTGDALTDLLGDVLEDIHPDIRETLEDHSERPLTQDDLFDAEAEAAYYRDYQAARLEQMGGGFIAFDHCGVVHVNTFDAVHFDICWFDIDVCATPAQALARWDISDGARINAAAHSIAVAMGCGLRLAQFQPGDCGPKWSDNLKNYHHALALTCVAVP